MDSKKRKYFFNVLIQDNNGDIMGEKLTEFSNDYIEFLNKCKTERQCVSYIKNELMSKGFVDISSVSSLSAGDKVFKINRNKSVYAIIIGDDFLDGVNIIGSHIDSPRLDLKSNPLYEDHGLSFFDTHYYGGIKKYQWTCIPLSVYGVIYKRDGSVLDVNRENDYSFVITDLLPHLAKEQMQKSLNEGVSGEDLNVLVGSSKDKLLDVLGKRYGIVEDDFVSAELEVVPSFNASKIGFDYSMIGGYGQDDRACSYALLRALIDCNVSSKSVIGIFADKEEIGSYGNTGMMSHSFDEFILEVSDKLGLVDFNLYAMFNSSCMLSADVDNGYDPKYSDVLDEKNSAYLGRGVNFNKYTGSFGKSGASDASAEYISYIRRILDDNDICYQFSELGKVDAGGGGTIAYILANRGVDVIDCGIPVLSMHSPYEVINKFDLYMAYRFYVCFFESKKRFMD